MAGTTNERWQALDVLRGLSIIFMLLNLNPGAWEHQYGFLVHAKWEGGTFIDMVAPAFLFCIGAVIPLSLRRRIDGGQTVGELTRHIVLRGLMLVLIGLFLNAYPTFDWAHLRIPGVLQRIGASYTVVALFVLFTARRHGGFMANPVAMAVGFAVVLLSWFALLYFVPVPGFGAPRFDPVGSWPAWFDRTVLTTDHMFIWWPVDGRIVFDPDGLLSTWPVCANVLAGALVGHLHAEKALKRPALIWLVCGLGLMAAAVLLDPICPIVKNIWTSTFALFTVGFALACLAGLSWLTAVPQAGPVFFPAKVYGANPLLAYVLSFLVAPLIDWKLFAPPWNSLRGAGQHFFAQWFPPNLASLSFGLVMLALIFLVLWICHRRGWYLKL